MTETGKLEFLKEAGTGPITDAMTALGIGEWMVQMHPVNPAVRMAGRGFPIQYEYIESDQKSFGSMWEVIDLCPRDYVIVASARDPYAVTGGHVILGSKMLGAGGFLVDGAVRDYEETEKLDYLLPAPGLW